MQQGKHRGNERKFGSAAAVPRLQRGESCAGWRLSAASVPIRPGAVLPTSV